MTTLKSKTLDLLIFAIFLIITNIANVHAQNEKTIYLLDLSGSMIGKGEIPTQNIFEDVIENLVEAIETTDTSTEIVVIPFDEQIHTKFYSSTMSRNNFTEKIKNLRITSGNTNLHIAVNAAFKEIDTSKENAIVFITDGYNNRGMDNATFFSFLEDFPRTDFAKKTTFYYFLASPEYRRTEICQIFDRNDHMEVIESLPPQKKSIFDSIVDKQEQILEQKKVETVTNIKWGEWPWWLWIILLIVLLAVIAYIISKMRMPNLNKFSILNASIPRTSRDSEIGKWTGERGNSTYRFNPKAKPSSKNYGNPNNETFEEMGRKLGDPNPGVKVKDGYPVFDKDPATKDGKPLSVKVEGGIGQYLEMKKDGKINRQNLHEHAFELLAEKYNKSADEIKALKGDLAAAERLSKKWNCTVDEAFKRCDNPYRIQRVLHEHQDEKTIQLVPRMYHDNISHNGGIEAWKSKLGK